MRLLLDTQVVLWAAGTSARLSDRLRAELEEVANDLVVSSASLWEIAIKAARGRPDFVVDPRVLRRRIWDAGWGELPVTADHALAVLDLPPLHRDPFDRMLVAQARVDGLTLLTADRAVAAYGPPARLI